MHCYRFFAQSDVPVNEVFMAARLGKIRKTLYIIFAITISVLLFLYWQNDTLQVTRYSLKFSDLPADFDGFRIAQISDMHGKTFGKRNSRLAGRIRSLDPDMLIITGDMMSSTKDDSEAFLDFLELFDNACPVFMCLGNHEQIAELINEPVYNAYIKRLEDRGVILLDNKKATITRGKGKINLYGLTLELYHYSGRDSGYYDENLFPTEEFIEGVLKKPESGFNIMLAHHPAYFLQYASWGADLVFSGHIHGGIVRIPFMGGLLSPDRVFFPEYDAGLFEAGDSKMIVNRGLGYSVINIRLFNRPEISFSILSRM